MTSPPLDLTPAEINRKPPQGLRGFAAIASQQKFAADRAREQAERAARQRAARIQGGIDWSVCLVPNCGNKLTIFGHIVKPEDRDASKILPLCDEHVLVVQSGYRTAAEFDAYHQAKAEVERREIAKAQAQHEAERAAFKARRDGDIYFVKLGGLVKVGWSRDLYGRIKSYGASAEVLCHFPGTRDEETALHRQLRPALAKGREWYHDGDVIALYVGQALAKHGAPSVEVRWTEPKVPAQRIKNYRG